MKRYYCYDRLRGDYIKFGNARERHVGTKFFWDQILGSMRDSGNYTLIEERFIGVGCVVPR